MRDLLKMDFYLPKQFILFDSVKEPFKNDEKYFLCHLKSSLRSQDIYIFVLIFGHVEKAALLQQKGKEQEK